MKSKLFCSSFILKIMAMLFMTLDHIGFFLYEYMGSNPSISQASTILRTFGRFALPLFCFLLVEGALHTKSYKRYALRLTCILVPVLIVQIVSEFAFSQRFYQGNIFIDLILGLGAIYCIETKRKHFKWLLLPIILFSLLSMFCYGYEFANPKSMIWWLPYFLRPQYDIYSLAMILGIYFVKKIFVPLIHEWRGMDPLLYEGTDGYIFQENLCSAMMICIITLIQFMVGVSTPMYIYWNVTLQVWACASGIFLLPYNEKIGYNKKWFKYFSYLYYPLHLVIIFLIFNFIIIQ